MWNLLSDTQAPDPGRPRPVPPPPRPERLKWDDPERDDPEGPEQENPPPLPPWRNEAAVRNVLARGGER